MSQWFKTFADIQDKLLVGAYPLDREDVAMLEWMKVERVLNLVEDDEYSPGEHEEVADALEAVGIEEYRINLTDYGRLPSDKLDEAVEEVINWIEDGHRVYVHCRAGWQRSAAIAVGVVALTEGVGIGEALDLVRRRKPSADPLPEQQEDLLRWWAERDPALKPAGADDGDDELEGDDDDEEEEEEEEDGELDKETLELLRWWAERDPAQRSEAGGAEGDGGE
jgi:protein-tyrosine phosphatase